MAVAAACTAAERTAFRSLLRVSRVADRRPEEILALVGRPPRRYDPKQGRAVRMQVQSSPFIEDAVCEACGGSTEFANPVEGAAARSIRRHFRRSMSLGLAYIEEAEELQRRFLEASMVAKEIGAARGEVSDSIPQVLKSFDAGSHGQPVAGDFLLTHPLSCLFESLFDQAVILLDSDSGSQDASGGPTGLVLNKPTGTTLGQMLDRASEADKEWAANLKLEKLADVRLLRGGPVFDGGSLQNSLRCLHGFTEIPNSKLVAPDIWLGGDLDEIAAKAESALEAGKDAPVRLFLGHATWEPMQLAIELECGVWVRARGPSTSPSEADGASLRHISEQLCFGDSQRSESWREALLAAGLPTLANFPRAPGADQRLRGHVERQQRAFVERRPRSPAAAPSSAVSAGEGRGRISSRRDSSKKVE
eukprot:TRINITY_DN35779_c0_g1_i1.p1 TRINITY_DN35779_c0_g1~~TRINITY_DN35779_c0_g1_i1.p1  ORF type:complete len:427 (-),score=75.75 TRINITY_DN35779_c0_g1_i1:250-1509(-)